MGNQAVKQANQAAFCRTHICRRLSNKTRRLNTLIFQNFRSTSKEFKRNFAILQDLCQRVQRGDVQGVEIVLRKIAAEGASLCRESPGLCLPCSLTGTLTSHSKGGHKDYV